MALQAKVPGAWDFFLKICVFSKLPAGVTCLEGLMFHHLWKMFHNVLWLHGLVYMTTVSHSGGYVAILWMNVQ